jgi:glycosyltransferase involved in cell wall biosynthesis
MTIYQIWAATIGIFLLIMTWKTKRFTKNMILLKNLPVGHLRWPKVSFIVPACNEEEHIERATQTLLNIDYPNLEIVIVNDRSTDKTGEIAERVAKNDPRMKVIHIKELPAGWLGKVHALEKGIAATKGDWILLADADIHFSKTALKKALTYCETENLDFMTAVPDITTKNSILQMMIAQLFHQATVFFDPRRMNDPKNKTCYGQGAFMLVKRTTYERSEKLEWLRMEAIDDTGLALMMRRAGARMGAVAGKDEIQLEWYPSVRSFVHGVEKNAFAFSQYSLILLSGFLLTITTIFLGFTLAPALSDSILIQAFSVTSMIVYLAAIRSQMKNIMKLKLWQILLFPIAFIALPFVFLRAGLLAIWRNGIIWRGTFYSLDDLKKNQRMKLANLVFDVNPSLNLEIPNLECLDNAIELPDFLKESEKLQTSK